MKENKKKRKRASAAARTVLTLLLCAATFAAGWYVGRVTAPVKTVTVESASTSSNAGEWLCTVTYKAGDETVFVEKIAAGTSPSDIGYPDVGDYSVLAWLDGNGSEVEPSRLSAYTDMTFTARLGSRMSWSENYFPADHGLFRPESPVTRGELAQALYNLMAGKSKATATFADMDESDPYYAAAATLVSGGAMSTVNGNFDPDGTVDEEAFASVLSAFYRTSNIETAMASITGIGSGIITRAEAAVALYSLVGGEPCEKPFLPDVPEDYWASGAILACSEGSAKPYDEGFTNIDGYLYHINAEGLIDKNCFIGALWFDENGRFCSGSKELDELVAEAIRRNTTEDMTQDEKLRAMYLYVRDNFEYLRRNYYNTGDTGWGLSEALTMYSTGKGNCYCYAAAFWAAARGLGYDALAVSGTIGKDQDKHGWVEIVMDDGVRYVFDVEIEMAYRRDKRGEPDMYQMESVSARYSWLYVEIANANAAAPRVHSGELQVR